MNTPANRRKSSVALRTLVVTLILGCCVSWSDTQAVEPDMQIDAGGDLCGDYIRFSSNGDYLLLVNFGHVRRYDLTKRRFDRRLSFGGSCSDRFAISSDGTRLARMVNSINPEGYYEFNDVQIIDFLSGKIIDESTYPGGQIAIQSDVQFTHDDVRFLVVSPDGQLHVWNTELNTWQMRSIASDGIYSLSKSGPYVMKSGFVGGPSRLELRNFNSPEFNVSEDFENGVDVLSLSDNGREVLLSYTRFNDEGIYEHAWDILDAKTLALSNDPWILQEPEGYTSGSAWFGDTPIALYSMESGVFVFDVRARDTLFSLPEVKPNAVALSAGGRWLATARHSGFVEVYSLAEALGKRTAMTATLKVEHREPRLVPQIPHSGNVTALGVSEDGRIVALGGEDGYVSLWSRATGREFRRLDGGRAVSSLALSSDGSRILTGHGHSGGMLWDVKSGELIQRLDSSSYGDATRFVSLLADGTRTLFCAARDYCTTQYLSADVGGQGKRFQLSDEPHDYYYFAVSLAPDEASVSLALGDEGIGWMELQPGGKQRIVKTPGNVKVTSVAGLGGMRVVAGLSNGDVLLADVGQGTILSALETRETRIGAIVRLDDERLAVASYGEGWMGRPDDPLGEILIVSTEDLAVQERLTWNQAMGNGGRPSSVYIDLLAADGVGRWLASASQHVASSQSAMSLLQLWDTVEAQIGGVLQSDMIPARRVEFNEDDELLLIDGEELASLWSLRTGRLVRRFRHHGGGDGTTALIGDTLVYVNDHANVIESWSTRSGFREIFNPDMTRGWVLIDEFSADGSRIGIVDGDELLLFSMDNPAESHLRVRREALGTRYFGIQFRLTGGRVLLNFEESGIEVLEASTAESRWVRADIAGGDGDDGYPVIAPMLTTDHAGVVVGTDNNELLILDAATGNTRVALRNSNFYPVRENSIPVIAGDVVQGALRLTETEDAVRLERLSLEDGSVIGTSNLGLASLAFAASDRAGDTYLVADGYGRAVLWDTVSGIRTAFETGAASLDSVAFSHDGNLLAVAESDGSVGLWDISGGVADIQHLARLMNFDDGGWAVVAQDGRYDANDPADLSGLSWVIPDAPTEPVPVSIFYREYYEPGLLRRLLAGEALPPIPSIADLDRAQPSVEISSIEPGEAGHVNVTVRVGRAEAAGVGDLKLFRDGRLVGLDEQAARPGSGTGQRDAWQVVFRNIALPTLGADAVEFSAYAFNADGVKSETHRLSYALPKVEPKPRRAFVIAVGVNAYENRSWDLRYAADDARANGRIIARHLEASDSFDEIHTVSLIAERDASGAAVGAASRADLLAVLKVLAGEGGDPARLATIPGAASLDKAGPDDLLYLAFSGHGMSGDDGLFHLFLSDIGAGEVRVVDDALLARTLDSDVLARHLLRVDAGDFVMVIDACNSAASVEGGGFKPGPMGSRGLGQLAYDKAMRVLAASQAEAVALESDRLKHGMLTFAMLREGLAEGAADRAPEDRAVSISEMLDYGVSRVPLLYEDLRDGTFTPQGRGHLDMFGADEPPPSVQRPSLFDFRRGGREVRMPVLEAAD